MAQPAPSKRDNDRASSASSSRGTTPSTPSSLLRPVENPSLDISRDLYTALTGGFETTGAFSSRHAYPEAPNPCIHVDTVGPVGLPMSDLQAQHLLKGSGRCEFSSYQVQVRNPLWEPFISTKVLPAVCSDLGIKYEPMSQKSSLSKLMIWDTEALPPSFDGEKQPGTFASLLVVLPSEFRGGDLHFSHSGMSSVIFIDQRSAIETSVAAWYRDAGCTVRPILRGQCVALCYHLIHTSDAPPPRLRDIHGAFARLTHVLLSWRQGETSKGSPEKIAFLLEHTYREDRLRGGGLTGSDAHMLDLLRPLARRLRFKLYLANIEVCVTGVAKEQPPKSMLGRWASDTSDTRPDSSGEDVVMLYADEQWLTVLYTVDLEGTPVWIEDLDIDPDDDVIGGRFNARPPDEQQIDAGTLRYWYRRTVLLIWPGNRPFEVWTGQVLDDDISSLSTSLSIERSMKERRMVHHLLETLPDKQHPSLPRAAKALAATAIRWKDVELWLRAAEAFRADESIGAWGIPQFMEAVKTFGLKPIESFLDRAIANCPSNSRRFELLDVVRQAAEHNDQGRDYMEAWRRRAQDALLLSITQPIAEDAAWFLHIIWDRGLEYIHDTFVPKLWQLSPERSFWSTFIDGLSGMKNEKHLSETEANSVAALVSSMIDQLLMALPPFPMKLRRAVTFPFETIEEHDLAPVLELVRLCIETKNLQSFEILSDKMAAASGTPEMMKIRATQAYFPMIVRIDQILRLHPDITPGSEPFAKFFEMATSHILDYADLDSPEFNIRDFVVAFRWIGNVDLLTKLLVVRVRAVSPEKVGLAEHIASTLHSQWRLSLTEATGVVEASVKAIITELLCIAVDYTDFDTGRTWQSCLDIMVEPDAAMVLAQTCFTTANPALCTRILARITRPTLDDLRHIRDVRMPFVIGLVDYFKSHRLQMLTTEPYNMFILTVFMQYVDVVLGPLPVSTVADQAPAGFWDRGRTDYQVALATWIDNSQKAVEAFERLGDEPLRRQIFGKHYDYIVGMLHGTWHVPEPEGKAHEAHALAADEMPVSKKARRG